jgi:hypothetical protein
MQEDRQRSKWGYSGSQPGKQNGNSGLNSWSPKTRQGPTVDADVAFQIGRDAAGSIDACGRTGDDSDGQSIPVRIGRLDPETGTVVATSIYEIATEREDPQLGKIVNHFPNLGFRGASDLWQRPYDFETRNQLRLAQGVPHDLSAGEFMAELSGSDVRLPRRMRREQRLLANPGGKTSV